MKTIVILLLATLAIFSSQRVAPDKVEILGTWMLDDENEASRIYRKSEGFEPNRFGIQFKSGGAMVTQHLMGGCVKQQTNFTTSEGNWKLLPDNHLILTTDGWDGFVRMKFIETYSIEECTQSKLVLKFLDMELIEL
jgi:hypothetical protein